LAPLAESGTPIIFCEPGCYSAVRDDHPQLLRGQLQKQARAVAGTCVTFEEWAGRAIGSAPIPAGPEKILLHVHCHQKALAGTSSAVGLLSRIPGCAVSDLDSGCCGMAGSCGYETEPSEVPRAGGERGLFPAVRERPAGSVVVAGGFSCRHQIAHFTDTVAVHPAVLLASLK
jgi:Fe-S oxidoreductase